ncbi:tensin-3-like isoform X1 [Xiphophorus maculatus]|uniref:Tensin 3 n=1 Tax=Xiphophorus maculatus TaxID=8083 RepID=M3ZVV5_XIPMA|nr:tensin-3-like isoform X1 [Xiphophorus maculatus]XP_023196015.1 tensin-3-like isoform X1 [Xiphophorus maculatus]
MEELRQIDLTYITECIISIICPSTCPEDLYLQNLKKIIPMLESKHGHNYMLINLSQKHDVLTKMTHKIFNTGWLDLLAPSLDQIFNVCTAMENWLQGYPKRVLVLHCRGDMGRLGVLLASYIHFSNMSASADLSLDHFAMRKFYNDKLSALMIPSQKRYVWMVGSMLKGGLRMNPSPSFLLCVVLYGLPTTRPNEGCCLFLRVYQSLQAVCTSPVYHVNAAQTDRLYIVLQPAQLLKGDIMVVCYEKNLQSVSRQVVFRLQFHMGLVFGHSLSFCKADLDCAAAEDSRFPDDGKVELLFSESPEKIAGREQWLNGRCVTVDYDTMDPLVRRDSFQDWARYERSPPHVSESGNRDLYSKLRKKSTEEGALYPLPSISPSCSDRAPSASSDSGLSVASQGQTGVGPRRGATQDVCSQAEKLIFGAESEPIQALLEVMTELSSSGAGDGKVTGNESGLGATVNGDVSSSERETDILDDEDEGSPSQAPDPSSVFSLPSENVPATQRQAQTEYSTHSWVRQQQMVDPIPEQGTSMSNKERPAPLELPETPTRGLSSREAVKRGLLDQDNRQPENTTSSCQEDELASLSTDIDESIEQLNKLILDLDPTFVPVPTRCSPLSRSASLHTNGLSHKGQTHQSGWKQQKHVSDVVDYGGPQSPGWKRGGAQSFKGSPANSPSFSTSQHGHLYKTNSVDYRGQMDNSDFIPTTPAFPVSPPTPYVKHFSEFSQFSAGRQWDQHSWTQEPRGFLDGINHSGGSTDGDLFRSDVPVTQRIFGSMSSVSTSSPLQYTDSSTPPPVWHNRTPNSLNSPYPPQSTPPLLLSSPNAHSSPRGAQRGRGGSSGDRSGTNSTDLSSLLLLGNGGLEHSLLEAVEGLGNLNLGGDAGIAPLLPEKRRTGEVGELGSRSPSLSGFSSPRSGSSLSIPLSSSLTSDPFRGLSGASSPGADSGSKQDTVKFVQDTSKFWYKPDISRDQAIAVLKDKEPGSFIVRDSHSFRGAYGLAMKVATPPPSVVHHSKKVGDLSSELVRHFLIECTPKGVRLKGCPNEPYFGSLTALVCQHSITPLALPCKLILPDRDPLEELNDASTQTTTNSAAELLKQGAACNVWFLGSVELESLTGQQAVQKATTLTLSMDPPPPSTVVHFKVSAQGITLTDNHRKLFFRRHYTVNTVIFCSLDPQGRKWTRDSVSTAKIFGFVARKSQSETENVCHLFAEHDPEQPASAIVNFVSKVMIGSHKK